MLSKLSPSIIFSGLLMLLTPVLIIAQTTDELCEAFLEQAFNQMSLNCADMDNDSVCYGFGEDDVVSLTYVVDGETQVVLDSGFSSGGDTVPLLTEDRSETVESVTTAPFFLDQVIEEEDDEDESEWGIAIQLVTANLPRQLEENSAVYVLYGDARIENGADPETALIPLEAQDVIDITLEPDTPLFSAPLGQDYLVQAEEVASVSGTLQADAQSADGEWLRVYFEYERDFGVRATAWVRVADISTEEDIENLPVLTPETYTAMQRFFLNNSLVAPSPCEDVPPPGILIQGPDAYETDLMLNDLPIRVTSTIFAEIIAFDRMELTTISGFAVLYPETENQVVVPEGFSVVLCIAQDRGNLGVDMTSDDYYVETDCPEQPPTPLTSDALDRLQSIVQIPENLLTYIIETIPVEICPSGIGAVCQLSTQSTRIQDACDTDLLPPEVCNVYDFSSGG